MGEGVIGGTAEVPLFGIANVNIYIYIYLYWLHQAGGFVLLNEDLYLFIFNRVHLLKI